MPEGFAEIAALIDRLGSEDRATQRLACDEALEQLRHDKTLHPILVRVLHDGTLHARFAAALVLFRARGPTLRLLPALLDALEFEDGDLRWSATQMLTTLGRMQSEVLPVLLHEARTSQNAQRRRMTLYALRELAPERSETLTVYLESLDHPDAEIRRASLSCLAKVREPDRPCIDRVLDILREDPDPRIRRIAAVVLPDLAERLPEECDHARRGLRAAAQSPDLPLKWAAESALARLPGPTRGEGSRS